MEPKYKVNLPALGTEEFAFILHLTDREKLENIVEPLGQEIAELATQLTRKEAMRKLIIDHLASSLPKKGTEDIPAAKPFVATFPDSSQVRGTIANDSETIPQGESPTASPLSNAGENPTTDIQPKPPRVRKARGSIEERNKFIVDRTQEADNWLYRTEYQEGFIDEEDNIKEVTRGFLRRSLKDGNIIAVTVYKVAPTNKTVTATLYGLPSFTSPENREKYHNKLVEKLPSLGMFLTEAEAAKHKYGREVQDELNFIE